MDANAFIRHSNLMELGNQHNLVTTDQIVREIKDQQTRDKIRDGLIDLDLMRPSESSIRKIKEFAQKTGDLNSLSHQDINLMAMAYTLL